MDIIAQKRRIDLTWAVISGKQLNAIIDLLDAKVFYQVEFPDPKQGGATAIMVGYVGDLNMTLHRTDGACVWKDITIPFIEQ